MVKDKRKKLILLAAAAALLIVAAVWSALISGGSELESMTRQINAHGYNLRYDDCYHYYVENGQTEVLAKYDDWYPAFHDDNISIADALTDLPLDEAVAASKESGYPSDVETRGEVVLFLARADDENIITVFTLDGKLELCFIQLPETGAVRALSKP